VMISHRTKKRRRTPSSIATFVRARRLGTRGRVPIRRTVRRCTGDGLGGVTA
jgi:hypothetical protein